MSRICRFHRAYGPERSFDSLRSLRIRILFVGDREAVNVGCSIVKERMLRAGRRPMMTHITTEVTTGQGLAEAY